MLIDAPYKLACLQRKLPCMFTNSVKQGPMRVENR